LNTVIPIREQEPADHDQIEAVNRTAFGGNLEAKLVNRLRNEGLVVASLVAVQDDRIVGHILFSGVLIETEHGAVNAVSLAPMAVLPECQRQGIGSELVRRGLQLCRERGKRIVIVLGDPKFYTRFGFSVKMARWLQSPYSGDCWMALELLPGALDGVRGVVRYPEAFEEVG
jgi:putative acetyltransferase